VARDAVKVSGVNFISIATVNGYAEKYVRGNASAASFNRAENSHLPFRHSKFLFRYIHRIRGCI